MRRKNRKFNFGKIFVHPIFIGIVGFCVLIYITIPIVRNSQKQKRINDEIRELENEISRLDGSNSDLKKMINYLNSDQFVLEQARSNLNYKKAQENVAVVKNLDQENVIKDDKQVFDINEKNTQTDLLKDSNAYKWWSYFFIKT